jgi:hypothetical protein
MALGHEHLRGDGRIGGDDRGRLVLARASTTIAPPASSVNGPAKRSVPFVWRDSTYRPCSRRSCSARGRPAFQAGPGL